MKCSGESLAEAERQAVQVLEEELRQHGELTQLAFNAVGLAVSQAPDVRESKLPPSRYVATALLNRLSNDLHCAALLAFHGYAVQACCLVASMYELAYTVAAIGSDDSLAEKWLDHTDPTKSFGNVKDLTRDGLCKLGFPNSDTQVGIEYRVYRQLCWAKHGNPIFQKHHGHVMTEKEIIAQNGPDTSEDAVRAGWFALEHGAALALVAALSFITNHVPEKHRTGLLQEIDKIGRTRKQLETEAEKRWGTDDPFKGRWRT